MRGERGDGGRGRRASAAQRGASAASALQPVAPAEVERSPRAGRPRAAAAPTERRGARSPCAPSASDQRLRCAPAHPGSSTIAAPARAQAHAELDVLDRRPREALARRSRRRRRSRRAERRRGRPRTSPPGRRRRRGRGGGAGCETARPRRAPPGRRRRRRTPPRAPDRRRTRARSRASASGWTSTSASTNTSSSLLAWRRPRCAPPPARGPAGSVTTISSSGRLARSARARPGSAPASAGCRSPGRSPRDSAGES